MIWSGAEEVRRDGRSSFARAEARDRRSSWITATVEPREGEPWTSRVRVDWIALRPEDLVDPGTHRRLLRYRLAFDRLSRIRGSGE